MMRLTFHLPNLRFRNYAKVSDMFFQSSNAEGLRCGHVAPINRKTSGDPGAVRYTKSDTVSLVRHQHLMHDGVPIIKDFPKSKHKSYDPMKQPPSIIRTQKLTYLSQWPTLESKTHAPLSTAQLGRRDKTTTGSTEVESNWEDLGPPHWFYFEHLEAPDEGVHRVGPTSPKSDEIRLHRR